MLGFEVFIPEIYEPEEQLEASRNKAISTIMAEVSEVFPDIPYVGAHPTVNEQCMVWQGYAEKYAAFGRTMMIDELGNDSRVSHPSNGNVPRKLAAFTLGIIDSEISIRAGAYEELLPKKVVSRTELSELDKKRVHEHIANDWDLLQPEYKYSVEVLGQLTAKVLLTHALGRLRLEKNILVTGMQKEFEEAELLLTPHR